jgi:hypothetical protein
MKCDLCGAWEVAWVGPCGNLTGTKCKACGGTNCQVVEPKPPVSSCNSLLACPGCGAEELDIGGNVAGGKFVRCHECGARGPIGASEERAASGWNDLPRNEMPDCVRDLIGKLSMETRFQRYDELAAIAKYYGMR